MDMHTLLFNRVDTDGYQLVRYRYLLIRCKISINSVFLTVFDGLEASRSPGTRS